MDFKLGLMGSGNGNTSNSTKNNSGGGGSQVSGGGFNNNNKTSSSTRTSSGSEKSISKCRPFSEVEQHENVSKMARTGVDSSFNHGGGGGNNQFQQMMMLGRMRDSPTTTATTARMQPCSPTDSTAASEDVLVASGAAAAAAAGGDGSSSDHNISALMPPPSSSISFKQQQMYHQPQAAAPYSKQLGMQLASMGSTLLGLHEAAFGPRYPFTNIQWAELEHQALIFKYMMARAPLPPELIAPIRKSVAAANGAFHVGATSGVGVGPHHANHLDLEPGRCRRTDGKKWRCARLIVPDQKYCERHINRGKHKRKQSQQQQQHGGNNNTMQATTVTSLVEPPHHHHHRNAQMEQQQQILVQQQQQLREQQRSLSGSCVTQMQPNYMSAAPLSSKDRFLSSHVSKATFDLRPEQLLFSEVSGSTRALAQAEHHHHHQQQQQQAILHQDPTLRPSSHSSSGGDLPYASYMRQPEEEDAAFNYYAVALTAALQQEQSFPCEDIKPQPQQALRPLFNEWPRSKHGSTVNSWSDSEDNNDGGKHHSKFFQKMLSRNSTTSLSMSNPLEEGHLSSSSNVMVKLSMGSGCGSTSGRDEQEQATVTTTTVTNADDDSSESNTDHASNKLLGASSDLGWFSAAKVSLGGPLAEAFNASEVKPALSGKAVLPSSSSVLKTFSQQQSSSSCASSVKLEFRVENL